MPLDNYLVVLDFQVAADMFEKLVLLLNKHLDLVDTMEVVLKETK